ncbi:oxidoreductase [Roseobacter cerasinus]|uniref:Oxidoreductase n=1 Tax=Roseobacter cerasinus TaxID=2602289 RepID=A0A640VXV2_9RHOB|nr:Gfo/Idh/MocA family oxidoreductase [Roseobacter cerasinus]GFE51046.1 oxidoreductase [Roseobacter cerasinus]
MKAVVFGSGSIGRRHIESLRQIEPNCEITLVRRDAIEDEYSQGIGASVVGSAKMALDMRPDLAVIATPSAMHMEALAPCILENVPIYLEKPAVTREADVSVIRDLITSQTYDAPSQTGCNLRFLPAMRDAHALLRSGALGHVARASFQAGQYLPDWRPGTDHRCSYSADPQLGGGVIFDLIHELDSAHFLIGPFGEVHAFAASVEALDIRSEAVATIILSSKKGRSLVTVGLDYVSRKPIRRYDIIGTAGTLRLDLVGKKMTLDTVDGSEVLSNCPGDFDVAQTYVTAMSELLDAIASGGATSQGIEAGLETATLALKAKASL